MKDQVEKAVSYMKAEGMDATIEKWNDPYGSFSHPEMFVFACDTNGTLLANPFLPGLFGMNRMNDVDPFGKHPIKQLFANALNGGGYTYYFFTYP